MDNLRWVLLAIGALIVIAIYLWDFLGKKSQPVRRSDIVFKPEGDLPMTAYDDEPGDYLDAITGLNEVLTSSEAKAQRTDSEPTPDVEHTVIHRQASGNKYDLDKEFFGEPLIDDAASTTDSSINDESSANTDTVNEEILILRITTKQEPFAGLKILSATKHLDMKFGFMNIFHHYGIQGMQSEKPVFSLANMFEPGEFNLQEMDAFTTKGLVAYMTLPSEMEAVDGFELMLSCCQRLADELGGELKGAGEGLLDDDKIEEMREIARKFR